MFGGASPIYGGAGEDVISLFESAGFGITQQAFGGAGADTFRFSFASMSDPSNGATHGQIGEITDFHAAEDSLAIDISTFPIFAAQADATNAITFDVVELAARNGSDLVLMVNNADARDPITGSVRLTGVPGPDPADVSLVFNTAQMA